MKRVEVPGGQQVLGFVDDDGVEEPCPKSNDNIRSNVDRIEKEIQSSEKDLKKLIEDVEKTLRRTMWSSSTRPNKWKHRSAELDAARGMVNP